MCRLSQYSFLLAPLLAVTGACSTGPDIPGPPALLVLAQAPSGWQQSGVPFARPPVIQLADADGNSVRQAGVIVTATITSGAGTLSGITEVATADTGMAIFEDLSITGPVGENTLTFSSPGLVDATSTFNLTAGIAGTILVHQGDSQVGVTDSNLAVTATADDETGIARVEFYEQIAGANTAPTKIGEDASRSYALERQFLSAAGM